MKNKKTLLELENLLFKLEQLHSSFDYIRISLASPTRIRNWSERLLPNGEIVGEVKKPETINFRSHEPEINGLFCEKIFGPIKNWKCKCGKYNGSNVRDFSLQLRSFGCLLCARVYFAVA